MALNTGVFQLSPLSALDFSGGGDMSLERERLRLMREQFAETKRRNKEEEELARLEESGRMARERMQSELAVQKQQAEQAAKLRADKQVAYQKFTELNGQGDIEGARSMVPFMSSLGINVELEGEEAGLPRYRVDLEPEQTARQGAASRMQAAAAGDEMGAAGIGFGSDESGPAAEPAGIQTTEEAFGRALQASQHFDETGEPLRQPDAPDYTGSVPKNVLDMGAIQDQTLARLNPALSGLVGAYPDAYRESAEQTAGAVRGLGLPANKAVEQFDKLRGGPDSLIRSEIEADAQKQKSEAPGLKDREQLFKSGFGYGKEIATKFQIDDVIERRKQVAQARSVLMNKDDADDYMAGATISRMMGERGATTEGDIERVLGTAAMSFLDRIKNRLYKEALGGLSLQQKNALLGVLKQSEEADSQRTTDFLSNLDEQLDSADTDRDVARGLRAYRNAVVPKDIRDEYDKSRGVEPGASRAGGGESSPMAGMEGVVIPETSRIAKAHNNPGNLKFADQPGAKKGEAAGDGGHFAQFDTVEEGLGALREQVELDAERGMSIKDFITKYAPPKSNDTAAYLSKALKVLRARAGDALAEVDPYDVVRFIAEHESSTLMPSQYDWEPEGDEEAPPETAEVAPYASQFGPPEAPATAATETAAQKRVRELLEKAKR